MRVSLNPVSRVVYENSFQRGSVDAAALIQGQGQRNSSTSSFTSERTTTEQFQGMFATWPPRSAHTSVFSFSTSQIPSATEPTAPFDSSRDFRIMRLEGDVRDLKWDVMDIDRDLTRFSSRIKSLEDKNAPAQSAVELSPTSDIDNQSDAYEGASDIDFRLMRIESDVRGLQWDISDIVRELQKLDQRLRVLEGHSTPQVPKADLQPDTHRECNNLDPMYDFRIMRLEGDVRDLKWDVMDIDRELASLERRMQALENAKT